MLDTGEHATNVRGLAVTPDGRQIVSASQDKTIIFAVPKQYQHILAPAGAHMCKR